MGAAPGVETMSKAGNQIPMQVGMGGNSLDNLFSNVSAIEIHQELQAVEACGWEAKNQYRIFLCEPSGFQLGQQIAHISESSDCCERQYCGPARSCKLHVHAGQHKSAPIVATLFKNLHL